MIDRIKALKKLDRKRLDATLMRIHGRPVLMVLFNLILLAINSLGRAKGLAKSVLAKAGLANFDSLTDSKNLQALPGSFKNRVFNKDPSVLIVCEVSIAQCFRYRVKQKLEQLELLGFRHHWVDWTNYMEVSNQINFFDVIIFYRVPGYPKMLANIEYANRLGKIVIYDTDDLIFERQTLESYYNSSTGQLSNKQRKAVFKGADLYKKAIGLCPYAITTTPILQQRLQSLLGEDNVFILPNSLDQLSLSAVAEVHPVRQAHRLKLFYGSGTKTHDEDFALIADPLEQILHCHDHVDLVLVGHLSLPEKLKKFDRRITKIDLLQTREYFELLVHADINLAPLIPGLFADCKSEIKWLEAAALGIPTVASATRVYQQAIAHGEDGFVADSGEQWFEFIDRLINDEKLRAAMGNAAAQSAQNGYSPNVTAQKFSTILQQTKRLYLQNSGFTDYNQQLKHVVMVNVLYPPQAMGGATVVAKNIVDTLTRQYPDRYHLSVFTCDVNNIYAYQVSEYEYDGVSVTAVSIPVGPDVDYREYDIQVEAVFKQFLEYKQPDLIHFHSIQRLTASMLQAALDCKTPFIVTVHDAWWLSDHQFLVDKQGVPVSELQANPMVAAQTSEHVQQTIQRKRILTTLLNRSEKVLAVSDYQRRFYQKNAIRNVILNTNGVDYLPGSEKRQRSDDRVVLGYSGSVSHHKGYYFLKSVLENCNLTHIKLKVINFNISAPEKQSWNTVEVEFLPKFESQDMAKFYQQIDVLIAPSMWPESFGLITREAALAGVWVIASDAGGLAELIVEGKNGFKFGIGDVDRLKTILSEIDRQPEKYKSRVPAAHRNTDPITSVTQQVNELNEIYQSVLDGR